MTATEKHTARVSIVDRGADPTFVECVVEDLWDVVKEVRKRSGPREQKYYLEFLGTTVEITFRRTNP